MNRRKFLASVGAVCSLPSLSWAAEENIVLWPTTPPGGGGPTGPLSIGKHGAISNIAAPSLKIFRPSQPNGSAMLIAGGGGYKRIELQSESLPAAKWLAKRGITAFVLSYRLPKEGWVDGPFAPLQDAQRAMRLIRKNAARFNIDPAKVGVLGFSAGAHLMGLTATRSRFSSYERIDESDDLSAKPDLAALIYPVITLKPPYDHTSTRKSLIGNHPTSVQYAAWSVETHVKSGCPPVFLVQAKDDPISNPENSMIMETACQKAGVPVELHFLPTGGHGFGMGHPDSETAIWPDWFETWLRSKSF